MIKNKRRPPFGAAGLIFSLDISGIGGLQKMGRQEGTGKVLQSCGANLYR